jgi:hypothetical protein
MSNDNLLMYGGLLAAAVVIALYVHTWRNERKSLGQNPAPADNGTLNLRLGAYERLVLLAERIALPSLVSRIPAGDLTVRQFQTLLTEQVRQEFDHNLSQQIYVSPQAWQAVGNLKEQNIFIINKVAETLPPQEKGVELSRRILELINTDPKVSLHPIVLEALNFEARKLL